MNVVYFIRLLLRNFLILIISPIVLFAIVFYVTKDEAKTYSSSTTIYSGIATGSSIVSLEDTKFDLFGTRTAFDNLINIIESRGTAEEVGLRLFTSHMILNQPSKEIISKESYDKLMSIVPQEVKDLVVKNDFEKTMEAFQEYKNKDYSNFIYELIKLNHPHYSYEKILSKLKVSRIQSSDMIELSYSSDDQGICLNTLKIVTDVFIRSYAVIRGNQSDAVLRYFQGQLDYALAKLDVAENELLEFNKSNNIINYYEQTKHIASEKEQFELDFQRIKMQHAAAESVIKILESKLSSQQLKQLNNKNISELRDKLAEINLEITTKTYLSQLDSTAELELADELANLQMDSYETQQELRNSIDKAYFIDNSTEGVASTSILQDWLEKVIELESTAAKLLVGNQRKTEYYNIFAEYAPLGATMKRLERKIDVAEREYLSILNSLNTAKLKQQNVELNSNLKIAEPPFFPIKSKPSKRKYLLLIALIVGFILPAFTIIVLDFLDSNIKNTQRISSLSKLKVAGIFPNLTESKRRIDYQKLEDLASEKLAQQFMILANNFGKLKPIQIGIISNHGNEGKTKLSLSILNRLSSFGYKNLFVSNEKPENLFSSDFVQYQVDKQFQKTENISDFETDNNGNKIINYDFIFTEFPAILVNSYPVKYLNSLNQILLVVRANRPWTNADKNSLKNIIEITKENKPQILLNGVEIEEMENVIAEIPGKKSFTRRFLKRMLQLQFFSKRKFK